VLSKILTKYYNKPIQILLVDHQASLLEPLNTLLKCCPFLNEIAAYATNSQEALEKALQLKPDLILMNMVMNENNIIQQISQHVPNSKILMLGSKNHSEDLSIALNSGANGYILKTINQKGINQAITAIMSGSCDFFSPDFNEAIEAEQQKQQIEQLLTRREQQIIKMIIEGKKSREISDFLQISIRTVEKHRSNLMKKLQTPTPIELVNLAKEMGWIIS